MGCERGESCTCKRPERPKCRFWHPTPNSKYYRCSRYINSRATCDLPKDTCASCPFFLGKFKPGPEPTLDKSPEGFKSYRARYMRAYRLKRKLKSRQIPPTSPTNEVS